jgi:hypothetical protein
MVYPSGGAGSNGCYPYSNSKSLTLFENKTENSNFSFIVNILGANGEENQQGRVVRVIPINHPETIYTRVVESGSGFASQSQYPLLIGTKYNETHKISVRFGPNINDTITFDVRPGQSASVYSSSIGMVFHPPFVNVVDL